MSNETGSLVQKLRLRHGWSQEQLAALCALNVRTIQRIESGQPPSLETLRALASVFEIDITALKEPEMDRPTMPSVSQDEMLAFAQVRRIKGFYLHLIQYLVAVGAMATQLELRMPCSRMRSRSEAQSSVAERSTSTWPPRCSASRSSESRSIRPSAVSGTTSMA